MNIPEYCFALNNMTINPKTKIGKVIKIVALETGYYPTNIEETQEFVDTFNKVQLRVSKAQAKAMESASMFGWNCYKSCLESYEKKFDSESDEPIQTEAYQDIELDEPLDLEDSDWIGDMGAN